MPRPPIDLHRKVRDILGHIAPLSAEAATPLAHYNRSSTDLWERGGSSKWMSPLPFRFFVYKTSLVVDGGEIS
jgi:hypothetical protein